MSVPSPGAGQAGEPSSAGQAMEMVLAGLGWLASADLASAPAVVQAECLRGLERAASVQVAARSAVLSAFDAQCGFEDDGQGTARTWLRWQTRITNPAAAGRGRVDAAPQRPPGRPRRAGGRDGVGVVGAAGVRLDRPAPGVRPRRRGPDLAGGRGGRRGAGGPGGPGRADAPPPVPGRRRRQAGFEDRQVRLRTTLGGAGRLDGDLTEGCAQALQAVLDALGKKAGPEDTRTVRQRHHDALEEACRRLIAAGMVPDRAGQPTQIQLHITLDELLDRDRAARPPGPARAPGPARTPGPARAPGASPGSGTAAGRNVTASPAGGRHGRRRGRPGRGPGSSPAMTGGTPAVSPASVTRPRRPRPARPAHRRPRPRLGRVPPRSRSCPARRPARLRRTSRPRRPRADARGGHADEGQALTGRDAGSGGGSGRTVSRARPATSSCAERRRAAVRARTDSRRTCAPASSPRPPGQSACPWTSARRPTRSRRTCAAP